jgi:nucleotide-binding universal stress UspA family protein
METPGNARLVHPRAILVATNLSDLHRLMPFAFEMASDNGARLILLHVLTANAEFTADIIGMPYYDREGAVSTATNMLEPWCERARKLGLQCTAIVREGQPAARDIIAAVRRFHPDRLILGTRSLGKLGRLLLGSVAEQVLRSANLPVFTIGPEAHLIKESSARQLTVLFATTLGEGHQANAALACQLAAGQGAKLVMFHVLPTMRESPVGSCNVLLSTIAYELNHLAHKIGADACSDVDIKIARGNPAVEILAEAAASHASLIVMGADDHSMFDGITHDRTICQVLAHAHCPVLSLHGPAAQMLQSETEAVVAH